LKNNGGNKPYLLLFNLEIDSDSKVLAAGLDWVRSFSKYCENVYVFSTHVGNYDLPKNVKVWELGGGGIFNKFRWVVMGFYSVLVCLRVKNPRIVFHHMSQFTSIHPGLLFRVLSIRQGMWYAHAQKNLSLIIAEKIVNKTFTSAPGAFPVKSEKLIYLGQGVDTEIFQRVFKSNRGKPRVGLISVGRISKVKNLDELLIDLHEKNILEIEFIGRNDNQEYFDYLTTVAKKKEIKLEILSDKKYADIPNFLIKRKYYYCGTRIAVDKAAIEAAASGCIIISNNKNVLNLTGMIKIYSSLNMVIPESLQSQIKVFEELSLKRIEQIQEEISKVTCELNNVNNTTKRVLDEILSL
jgi:glycosyltransferase involved in cell wall biosynthesis